MLVVLTEIRPNNCMVAGLV